jgi:hypothetical protein
VLWILANWTLISVKQANRASEIVRLEHSMRTADQEKIKEKAQLERSVEEIIQVHMHVANGNLGARVDLQGGNVLVPIAVPLNHLLSRHQQATQEAQERAVLAQVLGRLVQEHPALAGEAAAYLRERRSSPQERAAHSSH